MNSDRLFDAACTILRERGITTSRMFGASGLKVGGKVFALLVKGRLVVKLPRERITHAKWQRAL